MKRFEDMSCAELIAANQKLMEEKEQIREQQREINRVLVVKTVTEEVIQEVAEMSEERKQLMQQVLAPEGIVAKEKLGTPKRRGKLFGMFGL